MNKKGYTWEITKNETNWKAYICGACRAHFIEPSYLDVECCRMCGGALNDVGYAKRVTEVEYEEN